MKKYRLDFSLDINTFDDAGAREDALFILKRHGLLGKDRLTTKLREILDNNPPREIPLQ